MSTYKEQNTSRLWIAVWEVFLRIAKFVMYGKSTPKDRIAAVGSDIGIIAQKINHKIYSMMKIKNFSINN